MSEITELRSSVDALRTEVTSLAKTVALDTLSRKAQVKLADERKSYDDVVLLVDDDERADLYALQQDQRFKRRTKALWERRWAQVGGVVSVAVVVFGAVASVVNTVKGLAGH